MKAVKIAQYLYPKANLQYGDIRQYSPVLSGDIVFGNPPFHLEWGTKEAPVSSASGISAKSLLPVQLYERYFDFF